MSSRSNSVIRVILADDSDLTRRMARAILQEDPKIQVIGETQTGSNVRMLMALKPDVALVDLHMVDAEMISVLSNSDPKICVLVMSALVSAESMEFARKFGINEVLEKCDLGTTLVPAVKSAFAAQDRRQNEPLSKSA
jgi:two-component system invasion response regulator UvrY